jgi:hypothetical protein
MIRRKFLKYLLLLQSTIIFNTISGTAKASGGSSGGEDRDNDHGGGDRDNDHGGGDHDNDHGGGDHDNDHGGEHEIYEGNLEKSENNDDIFPENLDTDTDDVINNVVNDLDDRDLDVVNDDNLENVLNNFNNS